MSYYYPFVTIGGQMMPAFPFWAMPAQSQPLQPVCLTIPPPELLAHPEKKPTLASLNTSTTISLQSGNEEVARLEKKKGSPRARMLGSQKDSDENFGWRNQNKDRNILSNILKAFVNHFSDSKGLRNYLEQAIQKLDLQMNVSCFYDFIQQNFPTSRSYISAKSLKTFLRDPNHSQSLILVLKLTLQRFFQVDFQLVLLNSKKIKRRSKLEQMKKSRELLEYLFSK